MMLSESCHLQFSNSEDSEGKTTTHKSFTSFDFLKRKQYFEKLRESSGNNTISINGRTADTPISHTPECQDDDSHRRCFICESLIYRGLCIMLKWLWRALKFLNPLSGYHKGAVPMTNKDIHQCFVFKPKSQSVECIRKQFKHLTAEGSKPNFLGIRNESEPTNLSVLCSLNSRDSRFTIDSEVNSKMDSNLSLVANLAHPADVSAYMEYVDRANKSKSILGVEDKKRKLKIVPVDKRPIDFPPVPEGHESAGDSFEQQSIIDKQEKID